MFLEQTKKGFIWILYLCPCQTKIHFYAIIYFLWTRIFMFMHCVPFPESLEAADPARVTAGRSEHAPLVHGGRREAAGARPQGQVGPQAGPPLARRGPRLGPRLRPAHVRASRR